MTIPPRPINHKWLKVYGVVLLLLSVISLSAQVEPKDFVPFKFEAEASFKPVSSPELEQEMAEVIKLQQGVSTEDKWAMDYWNAAYPSYRWHQIMMDVGRAHKGHKNGGRVAVLHLAIYDALAEVWKNKQQHQVAAPFRQNATVRKMGQERDYSSFLCEWSAAAGAAHR